MDEEPNEPAKPAIPPPDLPKPSIPPPDLPKPEPMSAVPPIAPAAGPVKINIRDADDDEEAESKAGAIAPFNTRLTAAVIDVVVAIGLQLALLMFLPGFASRLAWVVGFGYLIARDSIPFLGGQSVGKKAMKIKAVTTEGGSLSGNWEPALIRNGVLLIPFFGLVELFVLLSREDKPGRGLRLGDEWAKTKVVLAPDPVPPADSGV